MKLIILLALASLSSGAKLDRTYLPPSHAQSSGGHSHFLDGPDFQNNDITQATSNGFPKSDDIQNGDHYQNNDYAQNGNYPQTDEPFGQANGFVQNKAEPGSFNDFNQRTERPQAGLERSAAILRQDNRNDGESYSYAYETSNGIVAEENGEATDGVKAQGGYSYTGDDGQVYSVRYTADENGFLPQGDHLPTPPPIPENILMALEKNAQDEANGIFDDGSYRDGKYDDGKQSNEAGYNYNNNNGINFNAGGNSKNAFTDASADVDDSVVTNNALLRSNNAAQFSFGNQNRIEKAYLPPFQQNFQRTQASSNGRFGDLRNQGDNGFGSQNGVKKTYLTPQSEQNTRRIQNNGFRSQANRFGNQANGFNRQNGVEKAYLPPQQFEQNTRRTQNNGFRNQANGFRNQANGLNGQNGVEKAYLPPQQFEQNSQAGANSRYNPVQNNSFRNQPNGGSNGQNGIGKAYLPPQQFGQRIQAANRDSNGQNEVNRAYLPPGQFKQRDQNVSARGRFIPQGNTSIRPSNIERSYLPPSSFSQGQSPRSQGGFERKTNVNREYLPPNYQKRNSFVSSAIFNYNDF